MCASEGSMEMERERVRFLKGIWGMQRMPRDGMKRMEGCEGGGDVRFSQGGFLGDKE